MCFSLQIRVMCGQERLFRFCREELLNRGTRCCNIISLICRGRAYRLECVPLAHEPTRQRETLGWEGHGLDALKTCFTGAIERGGTLQPRPPTGENAPAATDGNYCGTSGRNAAGLEAGSKAAELQLGENAAGLKPSRGSLAEVHPGAAETSDDEHKQRPPEFSLASDTEDAGGVTGIVGAVGAVEGGEDGDVRADGGGAAATAAAGASTATGTLDLHYADPGIVGPWAMRRVQGGLCDGLVDRLVLPPLTTAMVDPR